MSSSPLREGCGFHLIKNNFFHHFAIIFPWKGRGRGPSFEKKIESPASLSFFRPSDFGEGLKIKM